VSAKQVKTNDELVWAKAILEAQISCGFWCIFYWRPFEELLNHDVVIESDVAQHCGRNGLSLVKITLLWVNDVMVNMCGMRLVVCHGRYLTFGL